MVDEDVQPLQHIGKPADLERGEASGFSSTTAVPDEGNHGGNVFRQQISNSQRRRQEDPRYEVGVDRSDTLASSNYTTETMNSTTTAKVRKYQNQMPSSNPFAADVARERRMDTYDYSSSEDEDHYELQQNYTLSAPQHPAAYNPVSGRFTDTGYHPPAGISPAPTPPPPVMQNQQTMMSPSGDLADRRDMPPAPPPHAVGTTPQQI
jgi:hypothetical protein